MKRLLYIHNIRMPGPEANTVNVAKMCNAFAGAGWDVTLAALPGAPVERMSAEVRAYYGLAEDVRIAPLPRASARPTLAALATVLLAKGIRPDLLYTRTPHAAFAACQTHISTALELHTDISAFSAMGRWAALRAASHPSMRAVVAISGALARRLRELLDPA